MKRSGLKLYSGCDINENLTAPSVTDNMEKVHFKTDATMDTAIILELKKKRKMVEHVLSKLAMNHLVYIYNMKD